MNKPDFVPDRPIAFNREFVDLGAGIIGALVLSQAVYWSKRTKDRHGWFYKTAQEWRDEIGVTRWELETARKRLIEIGVMDYKKKGVPCKSHYRVKADNLHRLLFGKEKSQFAEIPQTRMWENRKQVCTGTANKNEEIQQTITETTHIPRGKNTRTEDYGPGQMMDIDPETGEILSGASSSVEGW